MQNGPAGHRAYCSSWSRSSGSLFVQRVLETRQEVAPHSPLVLEQHSDSGGGDGEPVREHDRHRPLRRLCHPALWRQFPSCLSERRVFPSVWPRGGDGTGEGRADVALRRVWFSERQHGLHLRQWCRALQEQPSGHDHQATRQDRAHSLPPEEVHAGPQHHRGHGGGSGGI